MDRHKKRKQILYLTCEAWMSVYVCLDVCVFVYVCGAYVYMYLCMYASVYVCIVYCSAYVDGRGRYANRQEVRLNRLPLKE